ncbi:unnamed protein product [Pleuronectes platessa]|uniref:Uncharacterized protein n=1 Tax=Pleuronectes platessa TaxID=8262 RepID=A0A9N7W200_PLEPL|nr:unnamed protein product [Pleuronectes platessa]
MDSQQRGERERRREGRESEGKEESKIGGQGGNGGRRRADGSGVGGLTISRPAAEQPHWLAASGLSPGLCAGLGSRTARSILSAVELLSPTHPLSHPALTHHYPLDRSNIPSRALDINRSSERPPALSLSPTTITPLLPAPDLFPPVSEELQPSGDRPGRSSAHPTLSHLNSMRDP